MDLTTEKVRLEYIDFLDSLDANLIEEDPISLSENGDDPFEEEYRTNFSDYSRLEILFYETKNSLLNMFMLDPQRTVTAAGPWIKLNL